MKSTHVLIRPLDKITGTRFDVYVAASKDPAAYGLNSTSFAAAFERGPEISGTFFPLDLSGRLEVLTSRMTLLTNRIKLPAGVFMKNVAWNEAPVTIWSVTDLNWSTRETLLTGKVNQAQYDAQRRKLSIDAKGSDDKLDKELLPLSFDGSGGLGGEPDSRDKLKPAGWGYVENLEPVFYDNTRSMAMLDGYGNLQSIDWVAEGLNRYTSYAGNYATEAALAAALDAGSVKPGQWASCLAHGVIGFGAPPEGIVTCTATFANSLSGAIMKDMILNRAGVPVGEVDTASFDSLDTAMPRPIRFWTAGQENVKSMVERICQAIIATPVIDNLGRIAISRPLGGTSIATLDKSGGTVPRVLNHRPTTDWTPTAQTVARAVRPAVVLRRDQVNFADDFIPRGTFKTSEVYRIGNTVFGPDKAEWLYINTTPQFGSAAPLPVWPTTSNTWWQNIGPPATWSNLNGRPPLLTGEGVTVDEWLLDPSVWSYDSTVSFVEDSTGEGYIEVAAGQTGQNVPDFENATPVDHNAMYEASWELAELGGGAPVAGFYTIVVAYDAAGVAIAQDGSWWFYPTAFVPVTSRNVWEVHSARFGRGTARPFPANAVKFGLGVIHNYVPGTPGTGITRSRRFKCRRISRLDFANTNPVKPAAWSLGDGKAIRNIGAVSWGANVAYGNPLTGPQRFSWRWVGPGSSSCAKMAGLSEVTAPGSYTDAIQAIYFSDTADRIEIRENGVEVATYTGITTRSSDEFSIVYDGLYLRPHRNGQAMGYEKLVGPGKIYRAMVDSYYLGNGINQIEHKSALSLAVLGANTVDINGNIVPIDALRNNLISTTWWKKGATIPWAATGNGTTSIITTPTDVAVAGLKNNPEDSMRVTKTGASGATIGGGWNNGPASEIPGINPDQTYRFILPVRRIGGDSQLYWGCADGVCVLNTTTPEANPYFAWSNPGPILDDRWYIFVGFIFPRNSTGKNNDSAGVYDCRTGQKIAGTTNSNFCFSPTFTKISHRAFQYYGTTDSTALFGKPIVNVVDGTEPELSTFFEEQFSAQNVALDWINNAGQISQGNTVTKDVGATPAWATKSISRQSYKSNAFISGRLDAVNTFLGFHELGNGASSYNALAYSFHRTSDWYLYKDGSPLLNMGTSRNGVTFSSLTDFAAFYDNTTVKFYADGVFMHEDVTTPDRAFQAGVAIYEPPASVSSIRFGPFTENTQVVVTPLDDIDIAADYLGAILSTQFNIVQTPIVKRGGVDFRTDNRMTYEIVNKTGGLVTAGYVTVNNTTASADKGRVTITNASASGTYTLNVKFDNVVISSFPVKATVKPAAPPTGGGGGGGTKSGSFSVSGLTISGTTFVEKGRISGLVKAAGETIRCYLSAAEYTLHHTSTITRNLQAKWQYSVAGAESWTDVGTAVGGSSITYIAEDFASDIGSITCNQNVAPSNNTYDLRLVMAVSAAGGTMEMGIGINASVAIGV